MSGHASPEWPEVGTSLSAFMVSTSLGIQVVELGGGPLAHQASENPPLHQKADLHSAL